MDKTDILFKCIKEFINEVNSLINVQNTIKDQSLFILNKAITSPYFTKNKYNQIIYPFTIYCEKNESSILKEDIKSLDNTIINLQAIKKASINITDILNSNIEKENIDAIFKHLQLILTIIKPTQDNKDMIKQSIEYLENKQLQVVTPNKPPSELVNEFKDDTSKEGQFINNIFKQTENMNTSNPLELLSNTQLLMGGDDLDPEKLLLMLAKVAGKLKGK